MCEKGERRSGREMTDDGSLGKGTVKGSVFPREGMRYFNYGGRALALSSTGYLHLLSRLFVSP
jgi:hypothetical protein